MFGWLERGELTGFLVFRRQRYVLLSEMAAVRVCNISIEFQQLTTSQPLNHALRLAASWEFRSYLLITIASPAGRPLRDWCDRTATHPLSRSSESDVELVSADSDCFTSQATIERLV
jgi:hypothetical protein